MSHFSERTIGGLTIRIDRTLCVGFGDCVTASPLAFELDDEGIAALRPEAARATRAELLAACDSCPVDAISVIDAAETRLVP